MLRVDPSRQVTRPPIKATTPAPENLVNCNSRPEQCSQMYFASETDMLKAVRGALLDEIILSGEVVNGDDFTNLQNFVGLLADVC